MKYGIGFCIGMIGATLWEHNGFWTTERYEDLPAFGRFGYRMMCKGLDLMGFVYDEERGALVKR